MVVEGEKLGKKLIILDLNGTLVYRKTKNRESGNVAKASAQPIHRPYLSNFLDSRRGEYEVLIWSSAQPRNVDSMVKSILSPHQRSKLLRVWARDTLIPQRDFNFKKPSIKDLEIVWSALNLSTLGETKQIGPWDQSNTLLLDDSLSKAALQPFNHIVVPEFSLDRVKIVQELLAKMKATEENDDEAEGDVVEGGREEGEKEAEPSDEGESEGEEGGKENEDDMERRMDDILLQTIGLLETLKTQSDVSRFIRSGGLAKFGGKKGKSQRERKKREKTYGRPEYWARLGREACERLGIECRP
ncbi:HAD-like protein [Violaceomyces palustris]|uniref:HAD-like protein n=1 Tax=Violaceomyces palustris TaxID=1673888 RepID=A0ACD0NPI2_9BASI|nr:HAD-like protein [Violaceomyces palustris]